MGRRLFGVLAVSMVLIFLLSVPTLGEGIKDVKPGDPAYQAVKTLVEKGYLPLYEGGLFNGEKPVDRYTLASVIARLLSDLEEGKIHIQGTDAQILKDLTVEFRKELVLLSEATGNLKLRLDEAERTLLILKEDMAETLVTNESIRKTVGTLEEQLKALRGALNAQDLQRKDLEARLEKVKADFEAYRAKTEAALSQKEAEFGAYQKRMADELRRTQLYIIGALILGLII